MALDLEIRSAAIDQPKGSIIDGYAALFNVQADIGGYFMEQIAPGAFRESLRNRDVLALLDHDYGRVIGRKSAGTLRLSEDAVGLRVSIDVDASTPSGQEALGTVRRQDVKGMSFGFLVEEEEWTSMTDMPLRTIRKIHLAEVSLVAMPAYEQTSAWVAAAEGGTLTGRAALRKAEAAMRARGLL